MTALEDAIDFSDVENCPIRQVLRTVMSKWSSLVILVLAPEKKRFNQIQREIGDISHQVLSSTLKRLEVEGYVKREVISSSQIEVYYELTPQGESFLTAFEPLVVWANNNIDDIKSAKHAFDAAS